MDEGVETCQVYRAAQPRWEPGECSRHEGSILDVAAVHAGQRALYWPEPGTRMHSPSPMGPDAITPSDGWLEPAAAAASDSCR